MKKLSRIPVPALLVLAAALPVMSQTAETQGRQQSRSFTKTVTETVGARYLLFLPRGYAEAPERQWPLLVFLHGAGERGDDLEMVAKHGPPKLVKDQPDFPFILVSPQCPAGGRWSDAVVLGLIDEVMADQRVDPARVYLTGLSMGGYGTWSLGLTHPERFAAIAPICGGGDVVKILLADPEKVRALRTLPVRAFHGAKDPVVPPVESERMVDALKRFGARDVQLTVYPEAQHDAWTETYANPELYEWFLSHRRD